MCRPSFRTRELTVSEIRQAGKSLDSSSSIREKTFHEMKKRCRDDHCSKSKETRRMEMGSIFVLYIQPTIPTYMYITAL